MDDRRMIDAGVEKGREKQTQRQETKRNQEMTVDKHGGIATATTTPSCQAGQRVNRSAAENANNAVINIIIIRIKKSLFD